MKFRLVSAALLAALSSPVFAQAPAAAPAATSPHIFTGNVALASEYIYRGIGQTNRKPAIQGGFDYAHASGLYAGVWASNISWLSDTPGANISAPIEIDVYGGYKNAFGGGDWNYDVGFLTYNYPGSYPAGFVKPDTTELYGAIGWKWLSFKYSHVVSSHIFGFTGSNGSDKTRGSQYYELNATYDLGEGWNLIGHVGRQTIRHNGDASYTDWKFGATKDLGFGTVGLAYVDTNAKACGDTPAVYCNQFNKDLGKGRALLSFSKTF